MESELWTGDHSWNGVERFWNLCIFHVFVIFCFSLVTNSKIVKQEKRACCLFQGTKEGGSEKGSMGHYVLLQEDSRIEWVVAATSGKGKQSTRPAVKKRKWWSSHGPGEGPEAGRRKFYRGPFSLSICFIFGVKFRKKKSLINSTNFSRK